ncbi:nitrate- and nitrite sensing domain-containing protein [Actinacidiphila glaucinigra]|uniref:sensor histidine kinase n=1 Tax=Actinacidiphila glaucinigra TaxID=235986 RepID=UPI0029AB361A|nr:nitrate- and nitrite sensing domain-containing protein [Streptomyces sp. PA03-3a]
MRLRPRTIRTQLVVLLLVPLLSLAGLWTYSTFTSVRGAFALMGIADTYRYYGTPADDLGRALQVERRLAVAYVASDGGSGGAELESAERTTDRLLAVVREHAREQARGTELDLAQRRRLTELITAARDLRPLRDDVRQRDIGWSMTLHRYSSVIDPIFRLRGSLAALQSGEVARQGGFVIDLVRARELLSREDAMLTAAQVGPPMTASQYREFIGTIDGRKLLHSIVDPELTKAAKESLDEFDGGSVAWSLDSMETAARSAGAKDVGLVVSRDRWRQNADRALTALSDINVAAAGEVGEQARGDGMDVLVRTGAVSLAGLFLVVLSVVISLLIGRGIARRLTLLRNQALELSGKRLPEVLRRLRAGEELDHDAVARAAPDLRFGADEIGQVGRAFNNAQRAAVQAAVDQEKLRRGVSAVFTNLARRSQVLLHRQLTLLDAMERRSGDPADLDDLFRVDHIAVRMRRHAEGLLILSGNAPGRAWRRPVRLAEVARAAVGEVEHYQRVTVRRMPRVALTGPAVADVLHLLAELIDNATAFSPPDTKVELRGEIVAGGYVLEIEDRGLGMSTERLADANNELGEAGAGSDLPETDRLGLFTVGRLAARQGVRVTLRRGRFDGTVAVVFIPQSVLVDASGDDVETGEHMLRPRAVPEPPDPDRADAAPRTPRPRRGPTRPREEGRTVTGLPKRQRQASLVAQLRDDGVHQSPAEPPGGGDERERSPEEARSTITAFARGLARGRDAAAPQGTAETGEIGG